MTLFVLAVSVHTPVPDAVSVMPLHQQLVLFRGRLHHLLHVLVPVISFGTRWPLVGTVLIVSLAHALVLVQGALVAVV